MDDLQARRGALTPGFWQFMAGVVVASILYNADLQQYGTEQTGGDPVSLPGHRQPRTRPARRRGQLLRLRPPLVTTVVIACVFGRDTPSRGYPLWPSGEDRSPATATSTPASANTDVVYSAWLILAAVAYGADALSPGLQLGIRGCRRTRSSPVPDDSRHVGI